MLVTITDRWTKMSDGATEQVRQLLEDGVITLDDATAVQDFQRFLRMVGDAPKDEQGRWVIPKEWGPYVRGEGDAPERTPAEIIWEGRGG